MVGLVDDPRFELHEQGSGHPESPARVRAIRDALKSSGLKLIPIPAREATRAEPLPVVSSQIIILCKNRLH